MKLKLFLLLLGAGGGAAGMFYGQAPAMEALGLANREVNAVVVEERQEEESGRLVLVLDQDGDTLLATFERRAEDVAALVSVGDTVTLQLPPSGVFADDVPILRVHNGPLPPDSEGDEDAEEMDEASSGEEGEEDDENEGEEEEDDGEDEMDDASDDDDREAPRVSERPDRSERRRG